MTNASYLTLELWTNRKIKKINEELKTFCFSSSIAMVIKSRGLKWTGCIWNTCNTGCYKKSSTTLKAYTYKFIQRTCTVFRKTPGFISDSYVSQDVYGTPVIQGVTKRALQL
jgi:hypothetical protein